MQGIGACYPALPEDQEKLSEVFGREVKIERGHPNNIESYCTNPFCKRLIIVSPKMQKTKLIRLCMFCALDIAALTDNKDIRVIGQADH